MTNVSWVFFTNHTYSSQHSEFIEIQICPKMKGVDIKMICFRSTCERPERFKILFWKDLATLNIQNPDAA